MSTYDRPSEIEGEIRATRGQMDDTIDALKMKLSPGELLDQAMNYVKDGGGEFGHNFARRVQNNPVPLALMTASLAWLMISDSRGGNSTRKGDVSYTPDAPASTAYGYQAQEDFDDLDESDYDTLEQHDRFHSSADEIKRQSEEDNEAYNRRLYEARAKALGLRQNVEEQANAFNERVDRSYRDLSDRARRARSKMSAHARRQRDRASRGWHDASAGAQHRARQASDQAGRFYEDNPLVVGALGIAAGALLGGILPSTRREDELLGRHGDEFRSEARAHAEDVANAAGDVAARTVDTAQREAEREGLTPEHADASARDYTERARRVGDAAVEAGRDEAKRHMSSDKAKEENRVG